MGLSILSCI